MWGFLQTHVIIIVSNEVPLVTLDSSITRLSLDYSRSPAMIFCDRNTSARLIQIGEKSLSMNAFIVQQKERYLTPQIIVVSITILLVSPNG